MSDIQIVPLPTQSTRFNATDADVIFQSSDSVLFNIHRKNLEVTTGAFPPSNFSTQGQSVPLSEPSETLDLMFQYIYPIPQPDLSRLSFEKFAPLAEAVEKYQVFPAMVVCKLLMQKSIPEHGQEVLGYAVKHGYADLVGETAHILLDMPLEKALSKLPENLVVPWALYYSAWNRVLCLARSLISDPDLKAHANGFYGGPNTMDAMYEVLKKLDDVPSLQKLDSIFGVPSNSSKKLFDLWRRRIQAEITVIKPFVTYV